MPSDVLVPSLELHYPRVYSSVAPFSRARELNINASRQRLKDYYMKNLELKYDFVLLMDSDVVIDDMVVDMLLSAWKKGTTPCCNTKGMPAEKSGHVVTSCALVHREDYLEVDYMRSPYECQCLKLPRPFYVESVVGHEIKCKI